MDDIEQLGYPLSLEVLSGYPVYDDAYLEANGSGEELHISAAQWAQTLLDMGMMPIILSRDPLFYDLAVTIAFGLAFATVLTLGLAPVLYATVLRVPSPPRP